MSNSNQPPQKPTSSQQPQKPQLQPKPQPKPSKTQRNDAG